MPEPTPPEIIITRHAYKRAKERLRWKKSVLRRMAQVAFEEGFTHAETKGQLRGFLDKVWLNYKVCNNIRIYGEHVYIFADNRLVTIYRVQTKLIKHVKLLKERTN